MKHVEPPSVNEEQTMPGTQQSLAQTVQASDNEHTDTPQANQTNSPPIRDIHSLIANRQRIQFLGIEPTAEAEYPSDVKESSPMYSDDPVTFTDIIKMLPQAAEGDLLAVNEFVNDDGTVDVDAIDELPDINVDELTVNPETITDADQLVDVNDYVDIVDPRRKGLAALGYNTKFRWQVATDNYTIINPQDAYWPAYKTFKEQGVDEEIFGWADIRDWGGQVDIYIFFKDHTVERPGDNDTPIYVGLRTGYDFKGGRAMDVSLFGFDPLNNLRFYSLGARRSRRHVGDPNNPDHEKQHGRVPIREWWSNEYDNLLTWTDGLVDDIEMATKTSIDFSQRNMEPEEFYTCLDIPVTYAESAVERAKRHSPSNRTFTMWTLFYALSETLENEYQGASRAGTNTQYKIYADKATGILRNPLRTIENAEKEHQRQLEQEAAQQQTKHERALGNRTLDEIEPTELDGVSTEDKLGLMDKQRIAEEKEHSLFHFEDE